MAVVGGTVFLVRKFRQNVKWLGEVFVILARNMSGSMVKNEGNSEHVGYGVRVQGE